MIMNIDFKVSVRCMTYNQAAYIEDAMNGFCMQQTDFPFVCNVMDDASTDGEQEIIYKYLDSHFDLEENNLIKKEETDDYKLIFARHKENKNCYFAVFFLKYNHYNNQRLKTKKLQYLSKWENNAKYIALCEGDDYWIDPSKLQKQVDFMECHPNYSMCFHNAIKYKIHENEIELFNHFNSDQDLSIHDAIHDWLVPTASILIRREYVYTPDWLARIYSGDYSLILTALNFGKIYGFHDIMSLYRFNIIGGSSTARMKNKRIFALKEHVKLLESYNKGSNYKFNKEVSSRITFLRKIIDFQMARENRPLLLLINYTFYEKCFLKLKRFFIEVKKLFLYEFFSK